MDPHVDEDEEDNSAENSSNVESDTENDGEDLPAGQGLIVELTEALNIKSSIDVEDIIPRLSPDIIELFKSNIDKSLSVDDEVEMIHKRFDKARELYRAIQVEDPGYAYLYRLSDVTEMFKPYIPLVDSLRRDFKAKVNSLADPPTRDQIEGFFVEKIEPLSQKDHLDNSEKMMLRILQYNEWLDFRNTLCTKDVSTIDDFFDKIAAASRKLVMPEFCSLDDMDAVEEARRQGTIYAPTDALHNRGINIAWVMGAISSGARFVIKSALKREHATRESQRDLHEGDRDPSAFSLEIAIALKMGYGLKITSDGGCYLNPPDSIIGCTTNGLPGNGVIPTEEEQLELFRHCMLARYLYELPKNNSKLSANDLISALELLRKGGCVDAVKNILVLLEDSKLEGLRATLTGADAHDHLLSMLESITLEAQNLENKLMSLSDYESAVQFFRKAQDFDLSKKINLLNVLKHMNKDQLSEVLSKLEIFDMGLLRRIDETVVEYTKDQGRYKDLHEAIQPDKARELIEAHRSNLAEKEKAASSHPTAIPDEEGTVRKHTGFHQ